MKKIGKYTFGIGLSLVVIGFIYDAMFAGIPPQDPPLELQIQYARDAKIASSIMGAGLIVTIVGALVWLTGRVIKGGQTER